MTMEEQKLLLPEGCKENKYNEDYIRGSLKLEASTSKPVTSAGEEISIYVVIRNSFSIPVDILTTETHIPVDITDQLALKNDRNKLKEYRKNRLSTLGHVTTADFSSNNIDLDENVDLNNVKKKKIEKNLLLRLKEVLMSNLLKLQFLTSDIFQAILSFEIFQIIAIFKIFQINSDERVAVAVSTDEEKSSGEFRYFNTPNIEVHNEAGRVNAGLSGGLKLTLFNQKGDINLGVGGDDNENYIDKNTDNQIDQKINTSGITLYPGDSLVKHFVLKTRKWLFFSPVSHTFQIQVRYTINNKNHIDTLPFSIDIRAPMRASIIGSIIGSILGFIVSESKNSIDFYSTNFWLSISRTIIFALIIIVAFARKSNVQQVVSVEDFWGGLFTGFLVGYSGDTFIKRILGEDE